MILAKTKSKIMKRVKFLFTHCFDKFLDNWKEVSSQSVTRIRCYLFLPAFLIAIVCGPSAAIAQVEYGPPPGYGGHYAGRIVRADYGAEGKYADVTGIVRRLARDGIRFQVSNQTFGIDPNYGQHKRLRVIFVRPDGVRVEIRREEGESIRL
jgi:hypothetical protein